MLLSVLSVVDNFNGYNCFPLRCSSTGADFFLSSEGYRELGKIFAVYSLGISMLSHQNRSFRAIPYYLCTCVRCDALLHNDKIKKKFPQLSLLP